MAFRQSQIFVSKPLDYVSRTYTYEEFVDAINKMQPLEAWGVVTTPKGGDPLADYGSLRSHTGDYFYVNGTFVCKP